MQQHTIALITGIAASSLSAFCMLPQLIKIAKEKAAENVSIPMLIILIMGLSLWIVYGVMIKDYIIVISNSLSVVINVVIVFLSIKFKASKGGNQ
jgi:MtN3 and saliva related transmembrane protein